MRVIGPGTLAASVLLATSSFAAVDDCLPCPAYDCTSSSGTIPTGVSATIIMLPPNNGDGTAVPQCATCTMCKGEASVNINGNGTGWCVQIDIDGGGWGAPIPKYNRGGTIAALCDDLAYVSFAIVPCGGGTPAYTKTLCVNCGCTEV